MAHVVVRDPAIRKRAHLTRGGIRAKTLVGYARAVEEFLFYLSVPLLCHLHLESVDEIAAEYIVERLYLRHRPRGHAELLLSGLQHARPAY